MALKKSASINRLEQLARATAGLDPSSGQYESFKSSFRAATGNVATGTHVANTVNYPAGGSGVSHLITGVVLSYSGGSVTGGNVQVKDGTNVVFNLDIVAAGAEKISFNPPLKGSPNTALSVVLADGGSGILGKVNVIGHYTES